MVLFNLNFAKKKTHKYFYFEFARKLVRKLTVVPHKLTNNSTKQLYMSAEKIYRNFELCNAILENTKNIFYLAGKHLKLMKILQIFERWCRSLNTTSM